MSAQAAQGQDGGSQGADPLQQHFLVFARKLLAQIREWTASEPVPEYQTESVQFSDKGWSTRVEVQPAYWVVVKKHYPALWTWDESRICAQRHLEAGVLKPARMSDAAGKAIVDPTFDQVLPFLATELAKPVIDLVGERGGPEVPDNVLVHRYREQRKEWGLESYRCEVLAPLVNFESEIERLAVGDRLQLAPMTPELKTKLAPLSSFLGPSLLRLEMAQSCVRANYVVTRGESIGVPDDLREDLDLFLTALRLLKSGAVVYGAIYSFCVDKPGSGMGASGGDWSRIGASYELKQDDSAAVLTVFDNLKQGKQEQWLRQLRIALGRFSDSYERRRPEDKLIDWTIALESTLLAGVETELKYRLSLRGATLLRGRFDPYWTQSILQAMYDARSGIVHSGKTLADIDAKVQLPASAGLATISQLPEMAEKVTRTIILEYLCLLRPGMTIKKINADLDRKIIAHLGK